jgi:CheY-like chemotaxis protein
LPPILADEERLHEVLENLIGNALKFTAPGGTITVGASTGDAEVIMWVEDSGAGIAPEELPHVFDRFWQARKVERRGTGLGLTITKAIVESHGGRIWLDSHLGQGTTARFSIPASVDLPASEDRAIATLLLVDDRPENLTALKAILDRPEYRLVTAGSGEEALKLALRQQFDVALIDVAMPGMNGLDVAAHLKQLERSRETPVIFITAYGDDPQQIHRAYAAGGADYLIKPLDVEIVRKKVAVFVGLSRRRQAHQARRNEGGFAAEVSSREVWNPLGVPDEDEMK